jgi:hypothetical protein
MQKLEYSMLEQQSLFDAPTHKSLNNKFIPVFRVSLVKDRQVSFGAAECQLNNSQQACPIFRKLIERQGQSDICQHSPEGGLETSHSIQFVRYDSLPQPSK